MYIKSVNQTVEDYETTLAQAKGKKLQLDNRDCDTGKETSPGEYQLSDKTYAELLDKLAEHNFDQVSPELRANILSYFSDPNALTRVSQKKDKKDKKAKIDWAKIEKEIDQLKAYSGSVANNQRQE
jgi:muramidase (phage lysozyme)